MAGTLVIDTLKSSTTGAPTFQNTSGTEVGQLCKAWVNFNPATGATLAQFNVSSVVRNGTGDYTVNFTNALTDANYAVCGLDQYQRHPSNVMPTKTSSQFRMAGHANDANGGVSDLIVGYYAVFR